MISITDKKLQAAIQIALGEYDCYSEKLEQTLMHHVKALSLSDVVRPNLTDKHPIEGVNETMLKETKISKSQEVCDGCGDKDVIYRTNVGNYCFFCDPT